MRTNVHITVQLGDLVVGAFDWAAQCSTDPREVPLLATMAVTYLLLRARKTSPSRQAAGLLPLGDSGERLAFKAVPSTSRGGEGEGR